MSNSLLITLPQSYSAMTSSLGTFSFVRKVSSRKLRLRVLFWIIFWTEGLKHMLLFFSKFWERDRKKSGSLKKYTITVCNLQSMKSSVELNSLFLKFFCYIIWFDETRHWRPCKRGLYVKSYCFFETIA